MPVSYNLMHTIDINCDLGEGFPFDNRLMPFISSANIACGFHAGDEDTIKRTIDLCLIDEVAIGAHPGFNDRVNFGRTNMQLTACELYDLFAEQIELMQRICRREGCLLHHVKPHGALYNMAAANAEMSYTIAAVIKELDASLIVYGLSNSHLITEAKKMGLQTASEVFADRTYQPNGTLTPRTNSQALINNTEAALAQSLQMVLEKTVTAVDGSIVSIDAATICIHGDGDHAVDFAKAIHHHFLKNNIHLKTIGA
ncbi:MAG: 5-oxoprolinase subunit PxpA [Sediminibacterium sp.]|nr:5-oxoprolinase subunit PxpA [Sediminibacterium sp.]